jgi:6-phosphogluconolactonase/glucosamine-6-phosphate isomerase/deaminase
MEKHLVVGSIKLEIHEDRKAAGVAAARAAAQALEQLDHAQNEIGVIFATGASQLEMLHALTSHDPEAMKVVTLDAACRQQQLAEGWFETFEDVPQRAFTLTIPTLLKVPKLILSVPGRRKAQIVRRTLEEPISTACPATILRTHPDVTLYLDPESASELNGLSPSDRGTDRQ